MRFLTKLIVVSAFFLLFPFIVKADEIRPFFGPIEPIATSSDQIRTLVSHRLGSTSPMLAVIECESGFRQFDAPGSVLVSHTDDYGIFQINKLWFGKAGELGYDILTVEGNIKMGLYILETQGMRAWVCARILGMVE